MAVLDGSFDGLLTKAIMHRYGRCANKHSELQAKYAKLADQALGPILKELRDGKRRSSKTFNGVRFTTEQVFTLLLNYGNEGNKQRVAETLLINNKVDILGPFDPKDKVQTAQAWARADAIMA